MKGEVQQGGERMEQAYAWAVRVHDARFADWDAFEDWIESDPLNLEAYNKAVDSDDRLPEMLAAVPAAEPEIIAANDDVPARHFWLTGGGVIAAGIALAMAFGAEGLFQSPAATTTIATAPGETREVALANGDKIILNGDSRITLDAAKSRMAVLEQGQALFTITHNAEHPFEVKVGDHRLVDAGTRFDVVREAGVTRVSVSEGLVVYEPQADAIHLNPGSALRFQDGASKPVLSRVSTEAVGAWKQGTLVYLDASIDTVAADLSRSLGAKVQLSGPLQKYSLFTGTLSINGAPQEVLPRLAPLLGVSLRQDGKTWVLSPERR